jgi:FMN reductase (NADPH)/FMN reductase [NAD(P)H]
MNPTLEVIHQRRSIRRYDPSPLTEEEKNAILAAAMRAPTAGNMMLYTIIEVEEQSMKDQLARTCDNQPFIAKAPYVLLFLADYQRWMDLYEGADCRARATELGIHPRTPAEGDLMLAMMDALIAAQTAALAAESLGIGSCYIGDIIENWETHQEMFNLPQYTFPAVLLCLGRPAKGPLKKRAPRFDHKFIVHKNQYRRFTPAELEEMYQPFGMSSYERREYPNGARNVVQFNYIRKFTAEFSQEMTRSVRQMLKEWCGE